MIFSSGLLSLNLLRVLLFKSKDESFLTSMFHDSTGLDAIGVSKSIAPLNRREAGVGLCDPREVDVAKLEVEAGDELEQDLFRFKAIMKYAQNIDESNAREYGCRCESVAEKLIGVLVKAMI